MTERVRALLITPRNELLTIRRERPGMPPYWVLPGGGVESTDTNLEAALDREVLEELGGKATILGLAAILDQATSPQYVYLARIDSWSEHDRTGPEFMEPSRGTYTTDLIPLTPEAIAGIDLKPDEIAAMVCEHLASGGDLLSLPDLRHARG